MALQSSDRAAPSGEWILLKPRVLAVQIAQRNHVYAQRGLPTLSDSIDGHNNIVSAEALG